MATFDDLKEVRSNLVNFTPFIASFLFGLRSEIANTDWNPTACTDGNSIFYNESFLKTLSFKQLETLVAHEVAHVAFAHHFRMRGKDGQLWNVATDHAINILLTAMGFVPLPNWLCDFKYKGMSAEDIYRDLKNQSPEQQEQQKQQSQQSGGSFSEPKNEDGSEKSDTELDEAKQEAKEKLQQAKSNLKRAKDAIEKSDSMTDSEKRERVQKMGKGLSELISEIDFESSSKADWRDILHRFLFNMAENDFAIHVPDQRFIDGSEFLMPSYESNEVGNLFVAMDVSGSCAMEAKQIATESKHILDTMEGATNSIMKACYCSNYIHRIHQIDTPDDLQLIQGGGTDFAPAIYAYADDLESQACIYITDGWCSSFGEDPMKPVLWVLTRRNDYFKPPFGEVVVMNQ
jgi:predicted metal-dependent peptidase